MPEVFTTYKNTVDDRYVQPGLISESLTHTVTTELLKLACTSYTCTAMHEDTPLNTQLTLGDS